MEEEIWKEIKDYEGLYEVSSHGRVRSMDRYFVNKCNSKVFFRGKLLKPQLTNGGYLRVDLNKYGERKHHKVHRLVAEAFIPNPDNLPIINHKDEVRTNNQVDNLEWCTHEYNCNYGTAIDKRRSFQKRKVYQYSMYGEFIREWESALEVQKQLGYSNSSIGDCCHGRNRTAYNYIWSFTPLDLKPYNDIISTLFKRVYKGQWFDEDKMKAYINENYFISPEMLGHDIIILKAMADFVTNDLDNRHLGDVHLSDKELLQ